MHVRGGSLVAIEWSEEAQLILIQARERRIHENLKNNCTAYRSRSSENNIGSNIASSEGARKVGVASSF